MVDSSVVSRDGTRIGFRRTGAGDPVVLVHGTTGGRDSFALVEPLLAEEHDVWVYDRRGRGASGDQLEHSLDREADDLAAVVEATGTAAHIVGHSYGAVCALLVARRQVRVRSLVLYEPPLRMDRNPPATVERAFAEGGDLEDRLNAFNDLCGITVDEAAMLRSLPGVWENLVETMRTTGDRERSALESVAWDRWPPITVPTLLLYGARTDRPVFPAAQELSRVLPNSDVVWLEDQGHLAFVFAPEAFAAAVLDFVNRH